MDPVFDSINPLTLIFLGISLVVLIIFTLLRVAQNLRLLKSRRSNQIKRVQKLTLSRMLEHLNIPLKYYVAQTSELDKERHMWACQNCPHPKECQRLLDGESLDVTEICPNHSRLKPLQNTSKPSS